jgi:hypothetical protein
MLAVDEMADSVSVESGLVTLRTPHLSKALNT